MSNYQIKKPSVQFSKTAIRKFEKHFPHLIKDGNVVKSLAIEFYKSEPDDSYISNWTFYEHLTNTFGSYHIFQVRTNGNVIFICSNNPGETKSLLTIYNKDEFDKNGALRVTFTRKDLYKTPKEVATVRRGSGLYRMNFSKHR